MIKSLKNKTAFITGPHPVGLPWGYNENLQSFKNFKQQCRQTLVEAIEYGISTFFTELDDGFDLIASQILIELKEIYPHIKLVAIIPCAGQEKSWPLSQQEKYKRILQKIDKVSIVRGHYARKQWMIENLSVCIACWNGKQTSTCKTVQLAKQNGCKVIVINPEN